MKTTTNFPENVEGKSFSLSSKALFRFELPFNNLNKKAVILINDLREFPEMFTGGKFKQDILNLIPEGEAIAVIGEGEGKWQIL